MDIVAVTMVIFFVGGFATAFFAPLVKAVSLLLVFLATLVTASAALMGQLDLATACGLGFVLGFVFGFVLLVRPKH